MEKLIVKMEKFVIFVCQLEFKFIVNFDEHNEVDFILEAVAGSSKS